MLTEKRLKEMEPGKIFLVREGDFPEISRENKLKLIAKRGDGYHDWCIYYHLAEKSTEFIAQQGDKVFTESVIKKIIECDENAWRLYRF